MKSSSFWLLALLAVILMESNWTKAAPSPQTEDMLKTLLELDRMYSAIARPRLGYCCLESAQATLTDWNKVIVAADGLSLLGLGVCPARGAAGVSARYIEDRLGIPLLVRETLRFSFLNGIKHPIEAIKRLRKSTSNPLQGAIFAPRLEERLRDVAIATNDKNTKHNRGIYRNILIHGHPDTGKTMFAKKLTKHSNMVYAILTGGDVAPMGCFLIPHWGTE
ncbi:ATPase family AAA domain-containing protein 3, N-terminal [Popillia japonica]|uniref:ATPase family AAA domain-containing protein 3, N-terminal n=1 Tax=Popillia japonica TaxID=7064 RepID=A0AAW1LWJ0_POPJA